MKEFYIRKYAQVLNFGVFIVDGNYIRRNVDEEFTNFGQHYRFRFIPKDEFWIDKEYGSKEARYYINHMFVENRLMSGGMSYEDAIDVADRAERRERHKSGWIKHKIQKMGRRELLAKIRKRLWVTYSRKVKVWIVNGELVRTVCLIGFTEGGHDKIYSFIPRNEIWIDDDVGSKERKFILLHEMHERNLMREGWGYFFKIVPKNSSAKKYKSAHRSANEIEQFCRHNPEFLDQKLKEELKKIK